MRRSESGFLALFFATHPAAAEVKVVTTTQDLASIVEAVGGTDVSVSSIARGDLDPARLAPDAVSPGRTR